jgi:hypothetical protein
VADPLAALADWPAAVSLALALLADVAAAEAAVPAASLSVVSSTENIDRRQVPEQLNPKRTCVAPAVFAIR